MPESQLQSTTASAATIATDGVSKRKPTAAERHTIWAELAEELRVVSKHVNTLIEAQESGDPVFIESAEFYLDRVKQKAQDYMESYREIFDV